MFGGGGEGRGGRGGVEHCNKLGMQEAVESLQGSRTFSVIS